jgi:hypothetical protein
MYPQRILKLVVSGLVICWDGWASPSGGVLPKMPLLPTVNLLRATPEMGLHPIGACCPLFLFRGVETDPLDVLNKQIAVLTGLYGTKVGSNITEQRIQVNGFGVGSRTIIVHL